MVKAAFLDEVAAASLDDSALREEVVKAASLEASALRDEVV